MESCEQAIQKRSLQPKKLKWMMMFKVRFEVSRLVPHARVQELFPPTGKPHLEDMKKRLASRCMMHPTMGLNSARNHPVAVAMYSLKPNGLLA